MIVCGRAMVHNHIFGLFKKKGMGQESRIDLANYSNIVILTGAGVSVASGIPPFRGPGGIWNEIGAEQLNAQIAQTNPALIWQTLGPLRTQTQSAIPNQAHVHLAQVEANLNPDQSFTLITQNIDGLHQKAGSKTVLELHGSLHRTRCSNPDCTTKPFVDPDIPEEIPRCSICGSHLLPDVVLFDEPIPAYAEWQSKRILRDCDLFIAIGTSGQVYPAANFVRSADYAGARTILINLEIDGHSPYFQEAIAGRAEDLLPRIM